MNLLDTLIPSFVPDLSKARKVKGSASLGDAQSLAFDHWLKKKAQDDKKKKLREKLLKESVENLKQKLSEARKDYAYRLRIYEEQKTDGVVARREMMKARTELNNRIRSFRRANESLQKLVGVDGVAELESLYVVEKEKVFSSA